MPFGAQCAFSWSISFAVDVCCDLRWCIGQKVHFFFSPLVICYIVMGLPVHLVISYYYASTAQGPFEWRLVATLRQPVAPGCLLAGATGAASPQLSSCRGFLLKQFQVLGRPRLARVAESAPQPVAAHTWGAAGGRGDKATPSSCRALLTVTQKRGGW